jgi:hypothetical protein
LIPPLLPLISPVTMIITLIPPVTMNEIAGSTTAQQASPMIRLTQQVTGYDFAICLQQQYL